MAGSNVNPYLKTRILTASAQELRLMLYDGAIRFVRQGQEAMRKSDFEGSYNAMSRAKRIVLELSTSLNHSIAPELCEKLSALYTYIYRQLVEAGLQKNADLADEPVQLLQYERDTWELMMKQEPEAAAASVGNQPVAETGTDQPASGSAGQAGAASSSAGPEVAGKLPAKAAGLAAGKTTVQPRLSASA